MTRAEKKEYRRKLREEASEVAYQEAHPEECFDGSHHDYDEATFLIQDPPLYPGCYIPGITWYVCKTCGKRYHQNIAYA